MTGTGYGELVLERVKAHSRSTTSGDLKVTDVKAMLSPRPELGPKGADSGWRGHHSADSGIRKRSGLDEDAREIRPDEFVVERRQMTETAPASMKGRMPESRGGAPKALIVASLSIRDAEETQCIIGGEPSTTIQG